MCLKIQDLIKINERIISTYSIKSYQRIRRKIDNSTFSSKAIPHQIKLFIKSGTEYTTFKYIYIYIFLNLQNERNFNEHPITVP